MVVLRLMSLAAVAGVAAFVQQTPSPRPLRPALSPRRPARVSAPAPARASCFGSAVARKSSETDAEAVAEEAASDAEAEVVEEEEEEEAAEATEAEAEEEEEEEEESDPNAEVRGEIAALEATLKERRHALSRANGAAQESGQAGYMRVVADVNTYKTQAAERQKGVAEVAKADAFKAFDAVLLAFESARADLPPGDDDEAKVHADFQLVYDGLMEKFEILGMVNFSPDAGETFEPLAHDAAETVDGDGAVATVAKTLKPGFKLKSGAVVRKATVVVSAAKPKEEEEAADADDADDAKAAADATAGEEQEEEAEAEEEEAADA